MRNFGDFAREISELLTSSWPSRLISAPPPTKIAPTNRDRWLAEHISEQSWHSCYIWDDLPLTFIQSPLRPRSQAKTSHSRLAETIQQRLSINKTVKIWQRAPLHDCYDIHNAQSSEVHIMRWYTPQANETLKKNVRDSCPNSVHCCVFTTKSSTFLGQVDSLNWHHTTCGFLHAVMLESIESRFEPQYPYLNQNILYAQLLHIVFNGENSTINCLFSAELVAASCKDKSQQLWQQMHPQFS